MFDLILKGGSVVDGTGSAKFTGDIAVKDGRIVEVGKLSTGALGFSTSRTSIHLTPAGVPIPGTFAKEAELMAIACAIGATGPVAASHVFEATGSYTPVFLGFAAISLIPVLVTLWMRPPRHKDSLAASLEPAH